jgi:hypothetical protein
MKTAESHAPHGGAHHAAHGAVPAGKPRASSGRLTLLVIVLTLPVLVIGLGICEALFALIVRVLLH